MAWADALGIGLGLLSVATSLWIVHRASRFGAGAFVDNREGFGG